jgi:hypothetical protein
MGYMSSFDLSSPGKSKYAVLDAGQREATAIEEAPTVNAGVRRLAANPLPLTALVLVHRASGRFPHRRVEAYIEVCNALGRTWRSARGVAEADLPGERGGFNIRVGAVSRRFVSI